MSVIVITLEIWSSRAPVSLLTIKVVYCFCKDFFIKDYLVFYNKWLFTFCLIIVCKTKLIIVLQIRRQSKIYAIMIQPRCYVNASIRLDLLPVD